MPGAAAPLPARLRLYVRPLESEHNGDVSGLSLVTEYEAMGLGAVGIVAGLFCPPKRKLGVWFLSIGMLILVGGINVALVLGADFSTIGSLMKLHHDEKRMLPGVMPIFASSYVFIGAGSCVFARSLRELFGAKGK